MYITKKESQILRKFAKIKVKEQPNLNEKGVFNAAIQHFGTLTDKEKASTIIELKMLISKFQSDRLN